MIQKITSKIKNFLEKSQDTSTKEFVVSLCVNFSFLFNGIFLIFVGELPVFLQNASENTFRVYSGCFCIAIWFIFLPILSRDTKDTIMYNFAYSISSVFALLFLTVYWLTAMNSSTFMFWDILAILVSIPTVAYLIYLIVNLFKLILFVLKKIVNVLLPEAGEKKGVLYTLEAITSTFLAISSLIAAFWGIITAIKTVIGI